MTTNTSTRRALIRFAATLLLTAIPIATPACSHESENCTLNSNCTPPDAGNAGSTNGGATVCSPACSGEKPVCDTAIKECVGCLKNTDCGGSAPLCDSSKDQCVQCLGANQCTSASASVCTNGTCTACTKDEECGNVLGKGVCNSGTCVQCTLASESAKCGTYSCNLTSHSCTAVKKGSVQPCFVCTADSECIGSDQSTPPNRCVPMLYKGAQHGTYCLQTVASAGALGCPQPYTSAMAAVSLSSTTSTQYCGINQDATTCEAIVEIASKTCVLDSECGIGQGDGLCKTVGTNPNRCTIPCGSSLECLSSGPGSNCVTASVDGGNIKFCQ